MMRSSRRSFLAAAGAAAFAGSSRSAGRSAVRLGGPIFLKSDDPAELAREHRRLGYSAAYCPQANATDTVRVQAIEKAFAAENVVIAEVGAWVNMLDPDAEKRRDESALRDRPAGPGRGRRSALLRGYRRVLQSHCLVRSESQEPVAGVLRRHGRQLPPCDRRDQAAARKVHHRDDGLDRFRMVRILT